MEAGTEIKPFVEDGHDDNEDVVVKTDQVTGTTALYTCEKTAEEGMLYEDQTDSTLAAGEKVLEKEEKNEISTSTEVLGDTKHKIETPITEECNVPEEEIVEKRVNGELETAKQSHIKTAAAGEGTEGQDRPMFTAKAMNKLLDEVKCTLESGKESDVKPVLKDFNASKSTSEEISNRTASKEKESNENNDVDKIKSNLDSATPQESHGQSLLQDDEETEKVIIKSIEDKVFAKNVYNGSNYEQVKLEETEDTEIIIEPKKTTVELKESEDTHHVNSANEGLESEAVSKEITKPISEGDETTTVSSPATVAEQLASDVMAEITNNACALNEKVPIPEEVREQSAEKILNEQEVAEKASLFSGEEMEHIESESVVRDAETISLEDHHLVKKDEEGYSEIREYYESRADKEITDKEEYNEHVQLKQTEGTVKTDTFTSKGETEEKNMDQTVEEVGTCEELHVDSSDNAEQENNYIQEEEPTEAPKEMKNKKSTFSEEEGKACNFEKKQIDPEQNVNTTIKEIKNLESETDNYSIKQTKDMEDSNLEKHIAEDNEKIKELETVKDVEVETNVNKNGEKHENTGKIQRTVKCLDEEERRKQTETGKGIKKKEKEGDDNKGDLVVENECDAEKDETRNKIQVDQETTTTKADKEEEAKYIHREDDTDKSENHKGGAAEEQETTKRETKDHRSETSDAANEQEITKGKTKDHGEETLDVAEEQETTEGETKDHGVETVGAADEQETTKGEMKDHGSETLDAVEEQETTKGETKDHGGESLDAAEMQDTTKGETKDHGSDSLAEAEEQETTKGETKYHGSDSLDAVDEQDTTKAETKDHVGESLDAAEEQETTKEETKDHGSDSPNEAEEQETTKGETKYHGSDSLVAVDEQDTTKAEKKDHAGESLDAAEEQETTKEETKGHESDSSNEAEEQETTKGETQDHGSDSLDAVDEQETTKGETKDDGVESLDVAEEQETTKGEKNDRGGETVVVVCNKVKDSKHRVTVTQDSETGEEDDADKKMPQFKNEKNLRIIKEKKDNENELQEEVEHFELKSEKVDEATVELKMSSELKEDEDVAKDEITPEKNKKNKGNMVESYCNEDDSNELESKKHDEDLRVDSEKVDPTKVEEDTEEIKEDDNIGGRFEEAKEDMVGEEKKNYNEEHHYEKDKLTEACMEVRREKNEVVDGSYGEVVEATQKDCITDKTTVVEDEINTKTNEKDEKLDDFHKADAVAVEYKRKDHKNNIEKEAGNESSLEKKAGILVAGHEKNHKNEVKSDVTYSSQTIGKRIGEETKKDENNGTKEPEVIEQQGKECDEIEIDGKVEETEEKMEKHDTEETRENVCKEVREHEHEKIIKQEKETEENQYPEVRKDSKSDTNGTKYTEGEIKAQGDQAQAVETKVKLEVKEKESAADKEIQTIEKGEENYVDFSRTAEEQAKEHFKDDKQELIEKAEKKDGNLAAEKEIRTADKEEKHHLADESQIGKQDIDESKVEGGEADHKEDGEKKEDDIQEIETEMHKDREDAEDISDEVMNIKEEVNKEEKTAAEDAGKHTVTVKGIKDEEDATKVITSGEVTHKVNKVKVEEKVSTEEKEGKRGSVECSEIMHLHTDEEADKGSTNYKQEVENISPVKEKYEITAKKLEKERDFGTKVTDEDSKQGSGEKAEREDGTVASEEELCIEDKEVNVADVADVSKNVEQYTDMTEPEKDEGDYKQDVKTETQHSKEVETIPEKEIILEEPVEKQTCDYEGTKLHIKEDGQESQEKMKEIVGVEVPETVIVEETVKQYSDEEVEKDVGINKEDTETEKDYVKEDKTVLEKVLEVEKTYEKEKSNHKDTKYHTIEGVEETEVKDQKEAEEATEEYTDKVSKKEKEGKYDGENDFRLEKQDIEEDEVKNEVEYKPYIETRKQDEREFESVTIEEINTEDKEKSETEADHKDIENTEETEEEETVVGTTVADSQQFRLHDKEEEKKSPAHNIQEAVAKTYQDIKYPSSLKDEEIKTDDELDGEAHENVQTNKQTQDQETRQDEGIAFEKTELLKEAHSKEAGEDLKIVKEKTESQKVEQTGETEEERTTGALQKDFQLYQQMNLGGTKPHDRSSRMPKKPKAPTDAAEDKLETAESQLNQQSKKEKRKKKIPKKDLSQKRKTKKGTEKEMESVAVQAVQRLLAEEGNDSGVDESTQSKENGEVVISPSQEGKASPRKRISRSSDPSPLKRLPHTTASAERKVPMNKIEVGKTASPNLKNVKSRIGSLNNSNYKPGGGNIKIETKKVDFTQAGSRIQAKNEAYTPGGGDKKIESQKLKWNVQSKVGSLDNKDHKAGGGEKKVELQKLDFKSKAKSKVGSKDNIKHKAGGGYVQVQSAKLDFKNKASSKVGSLNNVKHKPGGGDKKIFDDKEYLKQMQTESGSPCKTPTSKASSEGRASGVQSPVILSPPPQDEEEMAQEEAEQAGKVKTQE